MPGEQPLAATAAEATAVTNLVRDYSIETTVQQAKRIDHFADTVARGTRIYIPHTPHTDLNDTIGLATRLRNEGMEPVPHIVARRIESLSVLEQFLARLKQDAAVTQVLIVAGDAKPAGELYSSLEILESGLLEKYGVRTIGVAGHPEGHPDVAEPVLHDALNRKKAYAQKTGSTVHIVTQFTFSADAIAAWEQSYAANLGPLKVTVGLPGLATVGTLLKYAIECGVGPSLQAFSKRSASLTKLLTVSSPDETIVGLARYKTRMPGSRVSGVHFFTFGGFQKTAEWANKIAAGKFGVTEDGGLLVI